MEELFSLTFVMSVRIVRLRLHKCTLARVFIRDVHSTSPMEVNRVKSKIAMSGVAIGGPLLSIVRLTVWA